MCSFDTLIYCNIISTITLANTSTNSHNNHFFFVVKNKSLGFWPQGAEDGVCSFSESLDNLSSPKRLEGMLSSWAKLPTCSPVQMGSQNGLQSQYSPLAGNLKQAKVLTTKLAGQTGSALNG